MNMNTFKFNSLIPELSVTDISITRHFYAKTREKSLVFKNKVHFLPIFQYNNVNCYSFPLR